jgi:D-glycero-D-manno-heptose 1,7-bisphosphate phosphatase
MIDVLGFGDDLFAGICIAPERPDEPMVYRKPSPRFIHETLREHGWAAEAAWMVGDSPSDWEAGRNAGVWTAAIVPDQAADFDRERWLKMGVTAHSTLLEWASAVFG